MACKGRLAEFVLHITNFIYFCSGVAILVVGALGLGSPSTVTNALSYIPQISQLSEIMYLPGISLGPSIYLTCVGSLAIILSFIGCGGAYKRNNTLIWVFGISTLLIMLFNIAVIIFYAIDPYFIETNVEYNMNITLKSSFEPVTISATGVISLPSSSSNNASAQAWVDMQFQQACCGVNGYQDYVDFSWSNNFTSIGVSNAVVPPSCCMQVIQYGVPTSTSQFANLNSCLTSAPLYTNTQGCSTYVMQQVTRYNFIYCVVAAGVTALQAIILCMTMWLLVVRFEHGVGTVL
jgi:hypothetical protein